MRNPFRRKNLSPRFLPLYALGLLALIWARPTPGSLAAGATLVLAGTALRSWGAGHLVKTARLTTSGPYAHLRHPLYAGTLLVSVGFSLIVGGVVALLLLALLLPWFFLHYFPRKERIESARLERLYGRKYALYRSQVPALRPTLRGWQGSPGDGRAAPRWSATRYQDNNELGTLLAVVGGLLVFFLRAMLQP